MLAMLLALVVAALISFWLSKKVTAPLRHLQEVVGRIGEGDLASRAVTGSNDEFATLGAAVNEMAEGLEERESLKGALVHYVRSQAADSKLWRRENPPTEVLSGESSPVDRRVTVMVTELKGFSVLADRMGSEKVFALLNDYFSTMIDLVLRHRGSLEKSSNDSVVAVFGSTSPDSHQVKNAVESAISMRHALEKIIHDWTPGADSSLHLRIGIHSGIVPVHTIGNRMELDGAAVGEIYRVADGIKHTQDKDGQNSLILSSVSAERIRNVFPMEKLAEESDGFELYQVSMPGVPLK
jgi:class 3 adenylate cyclase/HAMP domain-containing protein